MLGAAHIRRGLNTTLEMGRLAPAILGPGPGGSGVIWLILVILGADQVASQRLGFSLPRSRAPELHTKPPRTLINPEHLPSSCRPMHQSLAQGGTHTSSRPEHRLCQSAGARFPVRL